MPKTELDIQVIENVPEVSPPTEAQLAQAHIKLSRLRNGATCSPLGPMELFICFFSYTYISHTFCHSRCVWVLTNHHSALGDLLCTSDSSVLLLPLFTTDVYDQ